MKDWYDISFEITEDTFSLKMETAEMSNKLTEAQKKLFLDIVQVNYGLEYVKFRYDCKKGLIPKELMKMYIDHLNSSFDRFGKVMAEHEIFPGTTGDWVTLKLSPGEEFILEGDAVFVPRFLDKAVGD